MFYPLDGWNQGSECPGCALRPGFVNVSQAFHGTWHDSTYLPGGPESLISLTFTGVAVYVYHIVPNQVSTDSYSTLTNLSFFLDGEYVGQYIHEPDSTSDIAYGVPVYVNPTLRNTEHYLNISAGGPSESLLLFDYVVYTSHITDPPQSTSSLQPMRSSEDASSVPPYTTLLPGGTAASHPSTPSTTQMWVSVVGAFVGTTLASVAGLAAFLLFCRYYRRPQQIPEERVLAEDIAAHRMTIISSTSSAPSNRLSSHTHRDPVPGRSSGTAMAVYLGGDETLEISYTASVDFQEHILALREEVAGLREKVARLRVESQRTPGPPPYESTTGH